MTKNWKKFTAERKINFFLIKNYNLPGLHKGLPNYRWSLQPLKENIQHFKTLNFLVFSTFGSFCLPGSGYGSTDLIESGSGSETLVLIPFSLSRDWKSKNNPPCASVHYGKYTVFNFSKVKRMILKKSRGDVRTLLTAQFRNHFAQMQKKYKNEAFSATPTIKSNFTKMSKFVDKRNLRRG
jgi:hypothetical protein